MTSIRDRLRSWWEGELVDPPNNPGSDLQFIVVIRRRSPSSKLAHAVWDYLAANYKWLAPTVAGVIAVLLLLK